MGRASSVISGYQRFVPMPRRTRTATAADLGHKTSFSMTLAQNEVLEDLAARARKEAGRFVEKGEILRALLDALARAAPSVDLAGLKDEGDLARRIARALRRP